MYQFITITNNAKPSDPATRRMIRRQAMKGAAKAKRRVKNPRYMLELRNIGHQQQPNEELVEIVNDHASEKVEVQSAGFESQNPPPAFSHYEPGSGRRNPFVAYPVPMTMAMHQLIEHTYYNPRGSMCTFRDLWAPVAFEDAATFHQLLSNIALTMAMVEPEDSLNAHEGLAQHALAVKSINIRLNSFKPVDAPSLLTAILALGAHATIIDDNKLFQLHSKAVSQVIEMGGGIARLSLTTFARLLLFYFETDASARADTCPRFPAPNHLLPELYQLNVVQPNWDLDKENTPLHALTPISFPHGDELIDELANLFYLSQVITYQLRIRGETTWGSPEISGFGISRVVHRLLVLRPHAIDLANDFIALREATRLAALLSLAPIRRKFKAMKVIADDYVRKLQHSLFLHLPNTLINVEDSAGVNQNDLSCLVLWLLFMGGMEASSKTQQTWFKEWISQFASRMQVSTWEQVRHILSSIIWVDEVHSEKGKDLWCKVEDSMVELAYYRIVVDQMDMNAI